MYAYLRDHIHKVFSKFIAKVHRRARQANRSPALPPDNSWRTFTDNQGDTYSMHDLIATRQMMEQLWDYYQSPAPDPIPGGSPEVWGDTIGGYMGSSQSAINNIDGDTKFHTNGPAPS